MRTSSSIRKRNGERLIHCQRSALRWVSEAELAAFEDVAMGRCRPDLRPYEEAEIRRPADLLFIDQDLGLGDQMMGAHLALRASQCGFKGIICIVTAASHDEQARLRQLPYVHAVVGKGFGPSQLKKYLMAELARQKTTAEAYVS